MGSKISLGVRSGVLKGGLSLHWPPPTTAREAKKIQVSRMRQGLAACQALLRKPSPVVSPGFLSLANVYSGLPL